MGGVDTGWTFYTPYSTAFSNTHVTLAVMRRLRQRVQLDPHRPEFHRHAPQDALPGHDLVPAAAVLLEPVRHKRRHGAGDADSGDHAIAGRDRAYLRRRHFRSGLGGDPILFQHMFWFYSHPAVYIMILPGMGVISELVTCFSRKRMFGYICRLRQPGDRIRRLPRLGASHVRRRHQRLSGLVFSMLSFIVAVPSAIKVFNWTATMYKGSIKLDTPMLLRWGSSACSPSAE